MSQVIQCNCGHRSINDIIYSVSSCRFRRRMLELSDEKKNKPFVCVSDLIRYFLTLLLRFRRKLYSSRSWISCHRWIETARAVKLLQEVIRHQAARSSPKWRQKMVETHHRRKVTTPIRIKTLFTLHHLSRRRPVMNSMRIHLNYARESRP
jgi:hypothetical protein